MRRFLWAGLVFAFGCGAEEEVLNTPYAGDHPIDRVLHPRFEREGIRPQRAPELELCRRLIVDLNGIFPTKAELESKCISDVETLARTLQAGAQYLRTSERHWHDRLSNGDLFVDWRYLKDLYARIDALHRGELRYDDFAKELSIHPGFTMSAEPPERVQLFFRAFAGRPPSEGELAELVRLYQPFYVEELPDRDFSYLISYRAYFEPEACFYFGGCTTELFGGASIDGDEGEGLLYDDMSSADLEDARAIGRLLVTQPFFYEAAADEILDRLLGWNEGGRFPRRPGVILPEVRQALADHLREHGDYPAAERLVLTSWLYTQTTEGLDTHAPIYASGPLKPATAEVWLASMLRALYEDDSAICDVRYIGNDAIDLFYEAMETGVIDEATMKRDLQKLHALMEDRRPLDEYGADDTNEYLASLIGGCPLTAATRVAPYGLAFGYRQEALANSLCTDAFSEDQEDLDAALETLMPALFGRDPTSEDRADFEAACAGSCTSEIKTTVCVALAGSAELLFY
jgi:hypothetical protein